MDYNGIITVLWAFKYSRTTIHKHGHRSLCANYLWNIDESLMK